MSKRKRDDDVENEDATVPTNFRQQRRIVAAFEASAKQLSRAFKLAKGLEQQKMGRRLKAAAAKKDQKDMDRIAAEKQAIKALENNLCAQHYLKKSLMKIKAIAQSADLPAELSRPVAFPHDPASLNVHGRLCKSNPVQEAFPTALATVKSEFGIRDTASEPNDKKRKETRAARAASLESDGPPGAPRRLARADEAGADALPRALLDDGGEDSEVEFEEFQGRLASSDEEEGRDEDDVEVSDIEELERQLEQERRRKKVKSSKSPRYDLAADMSLSEDDSEEEPERETRKASRAAGPTKSSFIPSLTMGGYISGSGSDLEDDLDVAPKKNRRGQRARQKIWEQKYRAQANHLKKQERSAGWDPKRGAVGGGPKPQPRFAKGANSMPLENRRRKLDAGDGGKASRKDDGGPLHPSWEAAKRAKEKNSAPVHFSGKKISFE